MKTLLAAWLVGLVFGLGLTISQMTNPAKVLAFLDVFGAWDPSLILVMGGALVTTAAGYRWVWRRPSPLLSDAFRVPTRRDIDAPLLTGAILFGAGWGLAGLCPGPAIAGLGLGEPDVWLFVASMCVGMVLHDRVDSARSASKAATASDTSTPV